MDLQDIKRRIQSGEIVSQEEEAAYMKGLVAELTALKESDPDAYLALLKNVSAKVEQLTKTMTEVNLQLAN